MGATRSRRKWIGGARELYAKLYLKTSVHLPTQQGNEFRHKLFHIFGISTPVNASDTAVIISH
jgi:hypothetical protein